MTMAEGNAYRDVCLRPSLRQLLIDEGISILGALALLVAGGLDAVPYRSVLLGLGLLLALKVCYSLVFLRKMVYTITGEQLVYEHGVFSRSRDYIELYRVVDFDEKRNFLQLLLGREMTERKAVGCDLDGDGAVETEESHEERHRYHR